MIHLRPIPPRDKPKRCDTAALVEARHRVIRDLQNTKAEKEMDAKLPRHFHARQHYRKTGGVE